MSEQLCVTLQMTKDVEIKIHKETNTIVFISNDLEKFKELESKLIQCSYSVKDFVRNEMRKV